jgi:hypothetical protein
MAGLKTTLQKGFFFLNHHATEQRVEALAQSVHKASGPEGGVTPARSWPNQEGPAHDAVIDAFTRLIPARRSLLRLRLCKDTVMAEHLRSPCRRKERCLLARPRRIAPRSAPSGVAILGADTKAFQDRSPV